MLVAMDSYRQIDCWSVRTQADLPAEQVINTSRLIASEIALSITYGRVNCAVMMVSPLDLEDFAYGFSFSEGIIKTASDIVDFSLITHANGMEARMWLKPECQNGFHERRRFVLGAGGCGLCGVESLDAACPALPMVKAGSMVSFAMITKAIASLPPAQSLNHLTHSVHGAGFWTKTSGLYTLREDVGRHNALDKLIGALIRDNIDPQTGILLLTSRLSVELVQKAARFGVAVMVAISAPTTLALEMADKAGITVIAVARSDGYQVFTHKERLCRIL